MATDSTIPSDMKEWFIKKRIQQLVEANKPLSIAENKAPKEWDILCSDTTDESFVMELAEFQKHVEASSAPQQTASAGKQASKGTKRKAKADDDDKPAKVKAPKSSSAPKAKKAAAAGEGAAKNGKSKGKGGKEKAKKSNDLGADGDEETKPPAVKRAKKGSFDEVPKPAKRLNSPWEVHILANKFVWHNPKTGESTFHCPQQHAAIVFASLNVAPAGKTAGGKNKSKQTGRRGKLHAYQCFVSDFKCPERGHLYIKKAAEMWKLMPEAEREAYAVKANEHNELVSGYNLYTVEHGKTRDAKRAWFELPRTEKEAYCTRSAQQVVADQDGDDAVDAEADPSAAAPAAKSKKTTSVIPETKAQVDVKMEKNDDWL